MFTQSDKCHRDAKIMVCGKKQDKMLYSTRPNQTVTTYSTRITFCQHNIKGDSLILLNH